MLLDIERRLCSFLWSGNCLGRYAAKGVPKVAWYDVYLPKAEGVLA